MQIAEFLETWLRAQSKGSLSLCFPEGQDKRVQEASSYLSRFDAIRNILLFGTSTAELSSKTNHKVEAYKDGFELRAIQKPWGLFQKERQAKGKAINLLTISAADKQLFVAGLLLKEGMVDAVVAGNEATTGQVIRAGLATLGMQAGVNRVSGAFIMLPPLLPTLAPTLARSNISAPVDYPLIFSDSAVNMNPSSEDMVGIALSAAELHQAMGFGAAKLAFLSFSTHGSARGTEQLKVEEAASFFQQRYPQYLSDGELQLDAAIVTDVMQRKCPDSPIQARANCLIFPSLDAGNIAYKLAQRLAGFTAIGPILLGLDKPYCDLSRGALVEDIVSASIVSLMRSRKE